MSNYKKLGDMADTKDIFDNIIVELPENTSEEVIQVIERMAENHRTNIRKSWPDDPNEKSNYERMTYPMQNEPVSNHNTFCSYDWCGSLLSYFKVA